MTDNADCPSQTRTQIRLSSGRFAESADERQSSSRCAGWSIVKRGQHLDHVSQSLRGTHQGNPTKYSCPPLRPESQRGENFLACRRSRPIAGRQERLRYISAERCGECETLKPVAFITGGSSGIGLAAAQELLKCGYRVVLAARRSNGLENAVAYLRERHAVAEDIFARSLDVCHAGHCAAILGEIERDIGPIDYVLAAAGIAEPGLFVEQDLEAHRRHMEANYFGTLNVIRPMAQKMVERQRGHLVLVSSGAAFVGIYGYSSYAPSKFAVRGLAETLRAELADEGVSVSVAFPPDTDTPQYHAEQATKPSVTKAISAGGGLFSAGSVAERIVRQSLAGHFLITQGAGLSVLRWIHSLYAPFFLRQQAKLARKMKPQG
ncbi:MAG TPA: SDR family oxidoreductase [Rhabdaerophilum sp.]|nr:SDR family oxidoreductase [Rhabdaerophilum sp.]